MDDLIKEHKEKFGVEPSIIGMFWHDQQEVAERIIEAIESDKPYDEYKLLTAEQQKEYDAGNLKF